MRKLFIMRCRKCNHEYQYEGEEYEWENCPICEHGAPFGEFVEEERCVSLSQELNRKR